MQVQLSSFSGSFFCSGKPEDVGIIMNVFPLYFDRDSCTAEPPCECPWPYIGDNCDTPSECDASWNTCVHGTCYDQPRDGRGMLVILFYSNVTFGIIH